MDDFGLTEAVDRLYESVVAGVAGTVDGGLDAGFGMVIAEGGANMLGALLERCIIPPRWTGRRS